MQYYNQKVQRLEKAICTHLKPLPLLYPLLTFFLAFDQGKINHVPDKTGAIDMLPLFIKHKKTMMNRRIVKIPPIPPNFLSSSWTSI